jgi:hypothetical protein
MTKAIKHKSNLLGHEASKKKATINPNMVDLSNDPYFVSKVESAKRLLAKYGTPKDSK